VIPLQHLHTQQFGAVRLPLCMAGEYTDACMHAPLDPPSAQFLPVRLSAQLGSIGNALAVVDDLRATHAAQPEIGALVLAIKRAQSTRFQRSYADVLKHRDWGAAAQFFLQELYGDHDFAQRDQQFGRIAPAMQRLFPASVVKVATALVHLHAISEQLDHQMALAMYAQTGTSMSDHAVNMAYVQAWRRVGQATARQAQLDTVLHLGHELVALTRIPGLRTMLRMMRSPASATGLQHLQAFLEGGFDTFAAMQRSPSGASAFLSVVKIRETAWIARLFDASVTNTHSPGDWPELE
jgi:hypothetical protein